MSRCWFGFAALNIRPFPLLISTPSIDRPACNSGARWSALRIVFHCRVLFPCLSGARGCLDEESIVGLVNEGDRAETFVVMGQCYAELNEDRLAIAAFESAMELDPYVQAYVPCALTVAGAELFLLRLCVFCSTSLRFNFHCGHWTVLSLMSSCAVLSNTTRAGTWTKLVSKPPRVTSTMDASKMLFVC